MTFSAGFVKFIEGLFFDFQVWSGFLSNVFLVQLLKLVNTMCDSLSCLEHMVFSYFTSVPMYEASLSNKGGGLYTASISI